MTAQLVIGSCLRLAEHESHFFDIEPPGCRLMCDGRGLVTDRQTEVFRFIAIYRLMNGYAPSVREIGRDQGLASTHAVHGHLRALERKGLIVRSPGLARAIRPTYLGDQLLEELELLDPVREAS